MVNANQVKGAVRGLIAEGVSVREAVELIEKLPGWSSEWEYSVDDDDNLTVIDLRPLDNHGNIR